MPIERVDEVVEHHPYACRRCGTLLQGGQLVVAQLRGQFALQYRIGAGRTATQVCVRDRGECVAEPAKHALDHAVDALTMLQGAR